MLHYRSRLIILFLPPRGNVFLQDVNPESENRVNEAEAESQNNEVRVQFADETPKEQELTPLIENETEVEDENRDKRGSTGGGSGNILFDIIRVSRTIEFIEAPRLLIMSREKWRTRIFSFFLTAIENYAYI